MDTTRLPEGMWTEERRGIDLDGERSTPVYGYGTPHGPVYLDPLSPQRALVQFGSFDRPWDGEYVARAEIGPGGLRDADGFGITETRVRLRPSDMAVMEQHGRAAVTAWNRRQEYADEAERRLRGRLRWVVREASFDVAELSARPGVDGRRLNDALSVLEAAAGPTTEGFGPHDDDVPADVLGVR